MPMLETRLGEIHYKDYRKADFEGVPYLLVHGAGSQYRDYHSKMRRELQAICIDLPGHGLSPKATPISIEQYAKHVVAFIEALGLEKVILVGHSMGGGVAQQVALDYPQYLHGLILIATGANLVVNQAIINGIIDKPEETARLVTQWSWGKAADEKLIQQGIQHMLETSVEIIQADYIACDNFDVRERLSEIETPILIIAGALDKMTQLAWNQELAEKIPNSTLKVFEDNGHQVHVEQVDAVMTLMREWASNL